MRTKSLLTLWTAAVLLSPAVSARLRPQAPESFFLSPGTNAVLRWRVEGEATDADRIECRLTDYWGQACPLTAKATLEAGVVELPLALPAGYYEIAFPGHGQVFGVTVLPEPPPARDPFFCMDAALSWLVRDSTARESLLRVLVRSGIDTVRERVSWGSINPGPDQFAWEGDRAYDTLRQAYRQHGLHVLELFHDAPSWSGPTKGNPYPQDMAGSARAWAQIGHRWGNAWGGMEIWNEPDIHFGGSLPPDQYVPLVKAVAFGLAGGAPGVPVGGGVFTSLEGGDFRDACARNGLLNCVDFVSFHNYDTAAGVEGLVGRYREWLAANGKPGMPLWLTECGWSWKRGPPRPPQDQDAASALEIAAKGVEAKACGVARYFPFVLPYYEEGEKNFAMMDPAGTPLRAMAAYTASIRILSGKSYIGDLKSVPPGIRRARFFQDPRNRETVLAIYTGQATPGASLNLGAPVVRAAGIDGRHLPLAPDGTLSVADGLIYLYVEPDRAVELLTRDSRTMQLAALARQPPPRRLNSTRVIVQYVPDLESLGASPAGYDARDTDIAVFPVRLRVTNLGSAKLSLLLVLADEKTAAEVRATTTLDRSQPGRKLELEAGTSAEASQTVDLRQFAGGPVKTITALAFTPDGTLVDSLMWRVRVQLSLEEGLALFARQTRLPIEALERWRRNIVGDGQMEMAAPAGKDWRLSVHFGKGDPWVYPVFTFPEGADVAHAAAIVLRARCEKPAAVRLMLVEKSGSVYFTSTAVIPADNQWHAAVVRFAELAPLNNAGPVDANGRLDLDEVTALMLGMNSEARENTLEVSDLFLCGAGK